MSGPRAVAIVMLAMTAFLSACGGGAGVSEGRVMNGVLMGVDACLPVEEALSANASLAAAAGSYRLVLVGEDGVSALGSLTLRSRSGEQAVRGDVATPLDGSVEVNLGAVGAQAVAGLDSEDPSAPGVLVLEGRGARTPSITLRLGSEANDADARMIDGAYTVLEPRRIDDLGFAGAWRSGVGTERSRGHFCAWRDAS